MQIGLIGSNGSGKSSICSYLKMRGFSVISLSDMVREEVKKRNLPMDRDTLTKTANELKETFGAATLAEKALQSTNGIKQVVYDSIRNVDEVRALKQSGVTMIGVSVDLETRYKRILERGGSTDQVSFETFKAQDIKENTGASSGQNILAALQECQYEIHNSGSLNELNAKVDDVLKKLNYTAEASQHA